MSEHKKIDEREKKKMSYRKSSITLGNSRVLETLRGVAMEARSTFLDNFMRIAIYLLRPHETRHKIVLFFQFT